MVMPVDQGSQYLRRCIRSKNVEQGPAGQLMVLPYGRSCHQCGKSKVARIILCSRCHAESFCTDCIKEWYAEMSEQEVKIACPVCRGCCSCKTCLNSRFKYGLCKCSNQGRKIRHAHYLICLLLPILKRINLEQRMEVDVEAQIQGRNLSDIQPPQKGSGCIERITCSKCRTSIVDFHRSCPHCSYDLCLSCCQEIRAECLHAGIVALKLDYCYKKNAMLFCPNASLLASSVTSTEWKVNITNGSISCPPKEHGGCGNGILELRCIFPLNWTQKLEVHAEQIACSYDLPEVFDVSSSCSFCGIDGKEGTNARLREASSREGSTDNYLYCPSLQDTQDEDIEHFQKHWSKGQPVIVRDVLQNPSNLSWEPMTMFRPFLQRGCSEPGNDMELVKATDCMDWSEVEISLHEFLKGYMEGRTSWNLLPELLNIRNWPPPKLFQEHLPTHSAEFIRALPFPDYINPNSGILNLAMKLPKDYAKPDLGPSVHISYGMAEELGHGDSVIKLRCDVSDMVNVLAHTVEVAIPPEQLARIENLKKRHKTRHKKKPLRTFLKQKMLRNLKRQSSFTGRNMKLPDTIDPWHFFGGSMVSQNDLYLSCSCFRFKPDEDEMLLDTGKFCCTTNLCFQEPPIGEKNGLGQSRGTSFSSDKKLIANSCGAQWDIFRREDVPKLQEYLRRHCNEFRNTCQSFKHAAHPVHDQSVFLDTAHKKRLKEEYHVEPWTLDQHTGEAIIIPAGCPYQIRYVKSCIQVGLDFLSPENVGKCIQLIDELRSQPHNHKEKNVKLEVKKMALYSLDLAIKEIQVLTSGAM
ncbi:hypothetical protein QJS10_CPB11g01048 [Acorus calamus]|uniref:Lysine-specific demethylase JMJ25 n=1 Tax=Acorus calamus TaxID=4465 RepID=A0AAV9DT67_ACOCL|nr:hypothetical protein QJS10_CPB11g01048 [Acorus calamus]